MVRSNHEHRPDPRAVRPSAPGADRAGVQGPAGRDRDRREDSRLARLLVDDLLQRAEGRRDATPIAEVRVSEPGSRYIDFLIPGLVGLNIMSSGMWGIGWVIVETRQKKLLKRMIATPMRRSDFLLSFVLMRLIFLAVELPVLLLFAHYAFDVAVRGSLVLLVGLSLLGAMAFSGIGLLVVGVVGGSVPFVLFFEGLALLAYAHLQSASGGRRIALVDSRRRAVPCGAAHP